MYKQLSIIFALTIVMIFSFNACSTSNMISEEVYEKFKSLPYREEFEFLQSADRVFDAAQEVYKSRGYYILKSDGENHVLVGEYSSENELPEEIRENTTPSTIACASCLLFGAAAAFVVSNEPSTRDDYYYDEHSDTYGKRYTFEIAVKNNNSGGSTLTMNHIKANIKNAVVFSQERLQSKLFNYILEDEIRQRSNK